MSRYVEIGRTIIDIIDRYIERLNRPWIELKINFK